MTKNLIVLGAILFSFALTNSVSAYYAGYESSSYVSGYRDNRQYNYSNDPYYYNQNNYQRGYYEQYGYNEYRPVSQTNSANPIIIQVNPVNSANPNYLSNYQLSNSYSPTPYSYYQPTYAVASPQPVVTTTKPTTSTVNNYYYQKEPATVAKTNTTTTTNTDTSNTTTANTSRVNYSDSAYNNGLGASAYNGITALSFRGSGSFLPSSIWQWMLVVVLILAIIIISRMLIRKPVVVQENHPAHTH